jgi:hypothetical protein
MYSELWSVHKFDEMLLALSIDKSEGVNAKLDENVVG